MSDGGEQPLVDGASGPKLARKNGGVLQYVPGLAIVALLLYGAYELKQPDHPKIIDALATGVGFLFLAVIAGVPILLVLTIAFYKPVSGFIEANRKCSHGVRGGDRGRCRTCAGEQARLHERNERARAESARLADIERRAYEWQRREVDRLSNLHVPSLDSLRALAPYQFETLVAAMFRRLGYEVEQTPASNDRGRDGILRKGSRVLLFECKRYREGALSGRPDLQKFHSAIITDNADGGFFITTAGFSPQAKQFAAQLAERKITLVDASRLLQMLGESTVKQAGPQTYQTICKACGEGVTHDLASPAPAVCPNRHTVPASITPDHIVMHLGMKGRPRVQRRRGRWR